MASSKRGTSGMHTMEIDDTDMPHGLEVQFETAWSPPEEVCHAIREQFDDLLLVGSMMNRVN